MKYILLILLIVGAALAKAKGDGRKSHGKTQEISFDGTDIDGQGRSPDGAYLLQKKGVKFMPIYKVQKHFDSEIKNSVDYLR